MKKIQALTELTDVMTALPRGGYLVQTSEGYIQFGAPPETLKDTKLLPEGIPLIFVLPDEHFHPDQGISMAEVEFVIYFNFFIRKKKTTVYVHPDYLENLRAVLMEAGFGPAKIDLSNEVEMKAGAWIPDLMTEMTYFKAGMTLDNWVNIIPRDPDGIIIGDVKILTRKDGGFDVYGKGNLIAQVPAKMEFRARYNLGKTLPEPFEPPEFGITCLGPSHGFDHEQNTSGFIFWINKIGVMVDPPVNSSAWLTDSNVNPKLIDSVILTHCHADHDAGTFQKILQEEKITIYTTTTVMQSFLTKYSALTHMPKSTLIKMFNFHPVKMNVKYNIHGAIFSFYYTLHSIPTVGFHFSYRDKTLAYSSDHLNQPDLIEEMYHKGVLTKERTEFLLNYPWDADLIYHEAGIPPLHTPVSYLNSLPEFIQKKIYVYHIADKDFPKKTHLNRAKFGIGETVYPELPKMKHEEAYRILDVFSRIDVFQDLTVDRAKDLLLVVEEEHFKKGSYIIRKNTEGDKFYVIVSGNVSFGGLDEASDKEKVFGTFEYFGEASLLFGTPRTADVIAATDVRAYAIPKFSFLRLVKDTCFEKEMERIAMIRNAESWTVLKKNQYFKDLSSSQITQLEGLIDLTDIRAGQKLSECENMKTYTYLLVNGEIREICGNSPAKHIQEGDFLNDPVEDVFEGQDFWAGSNAKLFRISKEDFKKFLEDNPGLMMKILYDHRSE